MDEASFNSFLEMGTEINVLAKKYYTDVIAPKAPFQIEYHGWTIEDGMMYIKTYTYHCSSCHNDGDENTHFISFSDLLQMKG